MKQRWRVFEYKGKQGEREEGRKQQRAPPAAGRPAPGGPRDRPPPPGGPWQTTRRQMMVTTSRVISSALPAWLELAPCRCKMRKCRDVFAGKPGDKTAKTECFFSSTLTQVRRRVSSAHQVTSLMPTRYDSSDKCCSDVARHRHPALQHRAGSCHAANVRKSPQGRPPLIFDGSRSVTYRTVPTYM